MRREFAFALLAFLAAPFAAPQQPSLPTPPPTANSQPAAPTVYYAGPGVTAPGLLPMKLINAATGDCDRFDRTEVVSAVVDAKGVARDISLPQPAGTNLDRIAIDIVTTDRFTPGTYNGAPVSVAIAVELKIYNCIEKTKKHGDRVYSLQLRSLPNQKIDLQQPPSKDGTLATSDGPLPPTGDAVPAPIYFGGRVSAPVVLNSVEMKGSDFARKERIYNGTCLIALIVDAHGIPQNVHVVRSLEPTLDENAVESVRQYRFKPAMKDGRTPVAVSITIEVVFRLY